MKNQSKAFTLLEILLVVAIIAILAGIVIVAINPARQLGSTRDAQRRSDINTLYKAVYQYIIDKGTPPIEITPTLTPICDSGSSKNGDITCPTNTTNLSALVPNYLTAIPKDPIATSTAGYAIAKVNSNIYIEAPLTEIGFTNQPGYSSSTPIIAFVGQIPAGHIPAAATVLSGTSGGGEQATSSYSITFDANGGTGSMAAQVIQEGSSANLTTNTFTRASYTFSGWSTTSGGSISYVDGDSYTMGGSDVTLYAVWTSNGSGGDNYALQFNGLQFNSANYVSVPMSYNLAGDFTMEAWINLITHDGFWTILRPVNGSSVFIAVGNSIYLQGPNSSGWYRWSISWTSGTWHHIAVEMNGGTPMLFYDGTSLGTPETSGSPSFGSYSELDIGGNFSGGTSINGSIDEVRISNTARYLSDFSADLAAHRSNYLDLASDGNTVGLWKFNQGSGASLTDSSGNGHTGTLVNSPIWVTPGVE